MPAKLTLNKLAENLILKSSTSFSSDDFEKRILEIWRQEIPISTLNRLKKKLSAHNYLIETIGNDFLPIPVSRPQPEKPHPRPSQGAQGLQASGGLHGHLRPYPARPRAGASDYHPQGPVRGAGRNSLPVQFGTRPETAARGWI